LRGKQQDLFANLVENLGRNGLAVDIAGKGRESAGQKRHHCLEK